MFFLPSYTGFLSPKSWGLKCCTMYSTTSLWRDTHTHAHKMRLTCTRNRRSPFKFNPSSDQDALLWSGPGGAVLKMMEYWSGRIQLVWAIFHGHRGSGEDKRSEGVCRGPPFNERCLGLQIMWGMRIGSEKRRSKGSTFACLLETFV